MQNFLKLAAGLVVLGALGCGVGPTESSGNTAGTSGTGATGATAGSGAAGSAGTGGSGGSGPVCPDDPAEGPVPEECGIWVSASLGDDADAGTQSAPVATLTHAIELAAAGPGRVYACSETWMESLKVPGNVSIHGGFDCAAGWAYIGKKELGGGNNSVVMSGPDQITMTYVDPVEGAHLFLTNFHVEAASATIPSGSSIAIFVRDEIPIRIRRCKVVAGDAMDGLDGVPGDVMPADAGTPGNSGANACSAALSKGGAPSESACALGISKGGAGGDASQAIAADGAPGEPASNPPSGAGGLGEGSAPACTPGQPGADGEAGAFGLGGERFGHLTLDGYRGNAGEDGKPGAPGQGGGGGGGTFGKVAVCGAATPGGAAGGSGGGGGCGGKGGGGGQPGGASFAVAVRAIVAEVWLDDLIMRAGYAGKGGNGGPPQSVGSGGTPGKGGNGAGSIKPGCAGGAGGKGGAGGWGGGGQGGITSCWVSINGQGNPGTHYFDCVFGEQLAPGGDGVPFTNDGDGAYGTFGNGCAAIL